jgi:hypothetical protein
MATVAGIKIKTKPVTVRSTLRMDEKFTGGEPVWPSDADAWPDDKFDSLLRKSFNYYNYHYTQRECRKHIIDWMKSNTRFTKDMIRNVERSGDRSITMTACSLIMAARQGMPLQPRHIVFLNSQIEHAITLALDDVPEKLSADKIVESVKPTIQDRLSEKTSELIGELEGYYDNLMTTGKTAFKPYDFLVSNNVVQGQLGRYEELFTRRKIELELAQGKTDEQLKEAYRHYKIVDFKKYISWIDELLAAIEQYRGVKKATKKARVKKAPSKEKVISKLKYAKEDKLLKVVSINPVDIIGASELWAFDTKTRKLYVYHADELQGPLGVKGSAITGYSELKSVGKTLRKPAEQLKEFAKAGKVALRTFLKNIKSVEVKATGRINDNIVLLKVV